MFDGFSETTAKSILLGQYPITFVNFPHIISYKDMESLVILLNALKHMKEPNPKRQWWRDKLENNLQTLITFD